MTTTEKLIDTTDVTRAPKMRPTTTKDGVTTGMFATLAESIALRDDGRAMVVPAGTLLTGPICGGFHATLNTNYEGRKLSSGDGISYRRP